MASQFNSSSCSSHPFCHQVYAYCVLPLCPRRKATPETKREGDEDRKPHIKKPLNAFMLYMREERPKVVAMCKVKESSSINQILGQRVLHQGAELNF